jgi:hypothetical protein
VTAKARIMLKRTNLLSLSYWWTLCVTLWAKRDWCIYGSHYRAKSKIQQIWGTLMLYREFFINLSHITKNYWFFKSIGTVSAGRLNFSIIVKIQQSQKIKPSTSKCMLHRYIICSTIYLKCCIFISNIHHNIYNFTVFDILIKPNMNSIPKKQNTC